MINRVELLNRNNPKMETCHYDSPLTVGNGEFAFTADITGLQTFREEYDEKGVPLCTMSQWGWHETPNDKGDYYTDDDLVYTTYQMDGRTVKYPVEMQEGNEDEYTWLRENPHRMNLFALGFRLDQKKISPDDLDEAKQELVLYDGMLSSTYKLAGSNVEIQTFTASSEETLGVNASSALLEDERLQVELAFPYPSPKISGADWDKTDQHTSELIKLDNYRWLVKRTVDRVTYAVCLTSNRVIDINEEKAHHFIIAPEKTADWELTVAHLPDGTQRDSRFAELKEETKKYWNHYWDTVGIVDFKGSQDSRAPELERRLLLSQYLTAIQGTGTLPPQETGLTCNSWYGKFHLEMHIWHTGYLPLWNKPELLEKSLPWYKSIKKQAKENAQKNDFDGLRWPKMIAPEAIDSPSIIAPLLIWQQPHILYMLELISHTKDNDDFMLEYWDLVEGTADFMADFVKWDEEKQRYDIIGPLIPAQEEFDPITVKNPTFEVEYWRFGLSIALEWAEHLDNEKKEKWQHVYDYLTESPIKDNHYLAHENCPTTFEYFNRDHPSMLAAFGFISNDRINHNAMRQTLETVMASWNFESLWGWDFAVMAMCATRLGDPDLAMDLLLMDTPKNHYALNGNNFQLLRDDLPVYLPGNGSLLFAMGLMLAGWDEEEMPGIPKNDKWNIKFENISAFPN